MKQDWRVEDLVTKFEDTFRTPEKNLILHDKDGNYLGFDEVTQWLTNELTTLTQQVREECGARLVKEEYSKTLCYDCGEDEGICRHCDRRAKPKGKCDKCARTFNYK